MVFAKTPLGKKTFFQVETKAFPERLPRRSSLRVFRIRESKKVCPTTEVLVIMNQIKVWPHMTIVGILVALVAGLGTAFYFKHEQTAQAEALPNAARIQRVDGEVAFNNAAYPTDANSQANDQTNTQWVAATANQPFSVGDRIYTRENSHASLAFTGRNFARLYPNTELDVLDLSDSRTQLALRDGSAMFDVGYLAPGQLYEVGTPYGAVDFLEPGLYNVGYDNSGNILVSALSGVAQVVGLGGSGRVSKGEFLTLAATAAAQVALASMDHRNAGYLVDDYYRYQYPNVYDGRYNDYDAYLSDPYYYDPYRRNVSYQYASSYIPGLNDLDYYGDWQDVSGYGHCWRPRVDAGWVPYQDGYWANDYPYGPTWVSSEAWGYAPYHYGRWVNSGGQWFWVPEAVNSTPYYSPALVAFVPFSDSNVIGWVPLGPGDPYAPRYYDANWQPYYLTRISVVTTQLVNLRVPSAVTVVPLDTFGRTVDPRMVRRADMQQLAQVRPVLDPLTLTPLRNAVIHSAWGRGKIDLPPGIAKKLNDTRVVVSNAPPAPPFRKDLAKAMRVEQLPDSVKNQKLNVRDDRRAASNATSNVGEGARQTIAPADDAARKAEMARLAAESARGNRDARKQMQQLQQEQRKQDVEAQRAERAQRQLQQQPQGQRVAEPAGRGPERQIMGPQRVQPEPRKAAPASPRIESPRIRPETRVRPEPPRAAPRPQPQPRVEQPRPQVQQQRPQAVRQPQPQPRVEQPRPQPQPRQQVQQRQQAPKREVKLGPPQRAEAPAKGQPAQGQPAQGKGKGKKP